MSRVKSQRLKVKSSISGQVMLLTVLILSGSILGASTIAGYLMLLKVRSASDITNSAKAIFAADTGIEWELYKQFKNPGYPKPSLSNNTNFISSNDTQKIKSIGESNNIFRAFESDLQGATTTLP
jgi:hypothetical protein